MTTRVAPTHSGALGSGEEGGGGAGVSGAGSEPGNPIERGAMTDSTPPSAPRGLGSGAQQYDPRPGARCRGEGVARVREVAAAAARRLNGLMGGGGAAAGGGDPHAGHSMERGFGKAPPMMGRSLYLLGPGNGIRRAVHRFVHCKPFEAVIMACILANTVVMMLQDPATLSSHALDLSSTLATLDFVFLCIFTGEAALRIVALGFCLGPHAYLRDGWNRMDFVAVLSSWITVLPGGIPRFTALRALRGLKALRSVRFFTEIRAILRSLSFALSLIVNVLTIMAFFFLMLSISSVEAFHRSMRRRCVYNGTRVGEPALSLPERWCSDAEFGGSPCPPYQVCSLEVGNKFSHINFDNVLSAALALFEVMSQDGWVRDIMRPLMDAEYRLSVLYWVVVVVLLVFLILNLFVAVVTTSFARIREDLGVDSAFSSDLSAHWSSTMRSVKHKSRRVGGFARRGLAAAGAALERPLGGTLLKTRASAEVEAPQRPPSESGNRHKAWPCSGARVHPEESTAPPPSTSPRSSGTDPADTVFDSPSAAMPADTGSGTRRSSLPAPTALAPRGSPPEPGRFTACRRRLLAAVLDWKFEAGITLLILANTAFLSMEYHGMPEGYARMLATSEVVFSAAFALEMLVKIAAYGGLWPYLSVSVNVFDASIVALTSLDLVLRLTGVSSESGDRMTLNVSAVRAFRILRLLLKVKSLRQLIYAVFGSMRGVFNLLVFMFFVVAVASIMAMQLFGGELPPVSADGSSPPRANFDSYFASFLTMFQVLTGDQWTIVLADAIRTPSGPWIAPPFFVLYFMVSNYIILNLFIAVVLENFELSEQAKRRLQQKRAEEVADDLSLLGSASQSLKSAFWVRPENSGTFRKATSQRPPTLMRSKPGRAKGSFKPRAALNTSSSATSTSQPPVTFAAAEEKAADRVGGSPPSPAEGPDRSSTADSSASHVHSVTPSQAPPPLPPPRVNLLEAPSRPGPGQRREGRAAVQSSQRGALQVVMPTPRAPVTAMRLHAGYRAAAADSVPQEDRSVSLGALPVAKKQRRPQSAAGAAARSPHEVARARDTSPRGGARGGGGGATTPTHGPPALTLARESSPPRRLARRLSSGAHAAPLFQRPTSVLGPPTAWAASRRRRGRTGWNEVRSVHEPPRGPGAREASPSDSPAVATGDSRTGSRSSAAGQLLSSMPSSFFEESDIEPPRPPAQEGKHRRRSGQRRGGGRGSRTHGTVWTLWGRATPAAAVHSWRQRGRPWDAGGEAGAVPGEGAVGESSMQTSGSGGGSRGGQDLEGGALAGGAEGPRTAAVEHGARRDEFEVEEEEDDELEYGRSWCCRLRASNPVRLVCIRVVESTWFDRGILVVILASCVALALEQPHYYLLSEAELEMQEWVAWSSFVFFALFLVEFLLRVTAQGFWWAPAPYLADPFNRLDFFVLVVSGLDLTARVLSLGVGTATSISRALRVGRVLRPLRLVNKNAGMRVIVNALLQSVPAAFNVFLLSLLLFFIFGIIGVNMFAGVFYSCNDPSVNTRAECIGVFVNAVGLPTPRAWSNFPSSFNHIGSAIITLMEVTSLNWIDTARMAMDARGVDLQPQRNANPGSALFFILFVVVGSFSTVNLFVGVMVEQFRANDGTAILTPQQKHWVELERLMAQFRPMARREPPTRGLPYYAHRVTTHRMFEPVVFVAIFLNVVMMLTFTADSSETWLRVLSASNLAFLVVYSVEAVLKVMAQRAAYFRDSWNVFDFVCVAPAWAVLALPPGFSFGTQVMRIFRVLRVFRFARKSAGVRSLLRTMRISAPSLANLGFLLFLVLFVFAVVGQRVFGGVKLGSMLNRNANFRSIGPSLLTLFQMLAGDNWHTIMRNSQLKEPFCTVMPDTGTLPAGSDCGSVLALAYYPWFYIVVVFVFINLFVSLILENFSSSYVPPEENQGSVDGASRHCVTMADFDSYQSVWAKYDPKGSGTFPIHKLRSFLNDLEGSLHIPWSDRFSYMVVRVQVERAFRPGRRLRRTSAFNELLYVLCLYHMGVTSLPFAQQRKRAVWMLEARNAVASSLIGGVVHGFLVRWRMSKDPRFKNLSRMKRLATSQMAADVYVQRGLHAAVEGARGGGDGSTDDRASSTTAT